MRIFSEKHKRNRGYCWQKDWSSITQLIIYQAKLKGETVKYNKQRSHVSLSSRQQFVQNRDYLQIIRAAVVKSKERDD